MLAGAHRDMFLLLLLRLVSIMALPCRHGVLSYLRHTQLTELAERRDTTLSACEESHSF